MKKVRIAAAGNVEIPAYLTLREKGYEVRWERKKEGEELWFAEKDGCEFVAEGPIELLGVVSLYEIRGENWKATDQETDDFMKKYEI
jgi:hypothetical protein